MTNGSTHKIYGYACMCEYELSTFGFVCRNHLKLVYVCVCVCAHIISFDPHAYRHTGENQAEIHFFKYMCVRQMCVFGLSVCFPFPQKIHQSDSMLHSAGPLTGDEEWIGKILSSHEIITNVCMDADFV